MADPAAELSVSDVQPMVWFRMLHNAMKRDVEFPADEVAHRSREGSLMLAPGQSYEVTREEWDYLTKQHSDLTKHTEVFTGA